VARNKHSGIPFEGKRGLSVEVRGGNVAQAIKILNKKVKDEGLIRELRGREFYEKPSIKRRRKRTEAVLRQKKAIAKQVD
jgi:small subunit ribosomal protein S21